ncbi:hypothetical protein CKO51_14205 [Rhodopirellula sp. SM50]|nr:hypothetical protein [Rhodopirellula sp. SM50]PAY18860.1 hypothetical protein CKO51_14205 [Rhodopirellula sp. SM50]
MVIPPIIVYTVFAAFGVGLLLPLLVACWGQRDRPGARAGVILGVVFSIPTGLLSGAFLWSYLEEASTIPEGILLFFGPLLGCFVGTLVASLITREIGAGIAGRRIQRREQVDQIGKIM